jgi:hypothetical protein
MRSSKRPPNPTPTLGRAARRLALVAALAAPGAGVAAAPAAAGPEPEPGPSLFEIDYPGAYVMGPRAQRRVVARVAFENYGGSPSAGLDVCVSLPPGFRDATVDGRRERVRRSRSGARICWFAGVFGPDASERAVVRATAPRRPGRYTTTVVLRAVENAARYGETLSRTGSVRVRR